MKQQCYPEYAGVIRCFAKTTRTHPPALSLIKEKRRIESRWSEPSLSKIREGL
jgi:hypothetical protein